MRIGLLLLTLLCAALNVPFALDGITLNQISLTFLIGCAVYQGALLIKYP